MKRFFLVFATIFVGGMTKNQIPDCGEFVPVPFQDGYICVSPDYYKVGDLRVPLNLHEALNVAKENNAMLPTKEMVDAIWVAADLKLQPHPLPPSSDMTKFSYFLWHNQIIEKQIGGKEFVLVAGHKKDIIQPISPNDPKVTIYGWHMPNGKPIQPLSRVHGWYYKDYSHGLRLVRFPDSN